MGGGDGCVCVDVREDGDDDEMGCSQHSPFLKSYPLTYPSTLN